MALNWLHKTPLSVVETQARREPTAIAVVIPLAEGGFREVTYSELLTGAESAARGLWARGLREGERIAIWADNSLEWLEAWFGSSLIGATLVALNVRLTAHEATELLERTDTTRLLLGERHAAELLAFGAPNSFEFAALQEGSAIGWYRAVEAEYVPAPVDGQRVGLIQFTSGSTGMPKGVQLREGSVATLGASCASRWLLSPADRLYGTFSLAHNAGSTFTVMSAFTAGASVVLPTVAWGGGKGIAIARASGTTVLPVLDTIITDLLASEQVLPDLRLVVGGFDSTTARRVATELDVELSNTYGLTEVTANLTVGDLRDSLETRITRIGRPHPGLTVRIISDDGREASPEEKGEIQVRGWAQMHSYYGIPDAEQPLTADGFVQTGDIGSIDADGYIQFLGRSKDVIRSGGENISAFEIERLLESHPDVLQAAVVAAPNERYGEVPFAFVRCRPGATVSVPALVDFCTGKLAKFKIPRSVEFVDVFPLVGINKVSKEQLRKDAAALVTSAMSERKR